MAIPSLQSIRKTGLRSKWGLAFVLVVWLGATLAISTHNPLHADKPDSHCALCVLHAGFHSALPSNEIAVNYPAEVLALTVLAVEAVIPVFPTATGNRDPPLPIV